MANISPVPFSTCVCLEAYLTERVLESFATWQSYLSSARSAVVARHVSSSFETGYFNKWDVGLGNGTRKSCQRSITIPVWLILLTEKYWLYALDRLEVTFMFCTSYTTPQSLSTSCNYFKQASRFGTPFMSTVHKNGSQCRWDRGALAK